jgi:hypothetical protein
MTRRPLLLGLATLLAALLAAPARAGDDSKDVELKNEDLKDEVKALKKELASLRKMLAVERRANEVEMKLLNARLDRIERALARLAPDVSRRIASSFTPNGPVQATGVVRLSNRLPVMATVTVNGVAHAVPPLGARLLHNVPAGTVTYEVTADGYGVRPAVRTPLAMGEMLTLTVY